MPILTDDEREGTTLADGKYALERVVGRGGMATVFEALHTWTGRKVAVKVINSALTADPEKAKRYLQEARAATAIEHPNVVEVLDMGREESDGTVYIVFELLRGESLRDRLDRTETLGANEMASLLLPVLEALALAHRRGIVHRDLKPDNIFLQEDGYGGSRPKLLDFGIAKMEQSGSHATGPVSGTVEYLSPERAQGHPTGPTTDVWSLGVLMFECLTGALPFERETITATLLAIVQQPVPSLRNYPSVPTAIADVVDTCLCRILSRRYPDASELREALLVAVGAVSPHETLAALPPVAVLPGSATPSLPADAVVLTRPAPIPIVARRMPQRPRRRGVMLVAALISAVALVFAWRATQSTDTARAEQIASTGADTHEIEERAPTVVRDAERTLTSAGVVGAEAPDEAPPAATLETTPRATRAAASQSRARDSSVMNPRSASSTSVRRPQRGANGSLILD